MSKPTKIIVLIILTSFLVLIRLFEEILFYDPLISFFKTEHTTASLPKFNSIKLLGNVVLRFLMNTLVSIAMIWVFFQNKGIIKFSLVLYILLFILLFGGYSYLVFFSESQNYLPLFYVRRFLIQPLFLLILLPAFYFQERKK